MKLKAIATSALVVSMSFAPVGPMSTPAHADGRDVVAGMIIGGILGSAITNENNKKKRSSKSTRAKAPGMSAEQREANKEVQTALNYFGYPVGTPDGSIGPKSRSAITEYQAFLGYPATGELTEYERTILVTGYHRAVAGGPVIAGVVSNSVYGLKAVLVAQRDEMAGGAVAAAAIPAVVPQAPAIEAAVVEPEPEVEAVVASAEPALPSFMNPAGAKGSLAAECNQVSLATSGNGGMATVEGMQDANFALAEQFCLARSFAMAKSDELTANVAGFTPDQIGEQCAAFGSVLKEHVAAVSLKPADEVLAGVEGFIGKSGMSPAQLSGTAKVCLGVGYARDDMDVAIGSALLLAAMGEAGYGEYIGHHLSQGFGATERPDLAMIWYEMSLDAMGKGQMVVAPNVAGRDAVIRKAAYTINGRAAELAPDAVVEDVSLPVLDVVPEPASAPALVEEAVVAPEAAAPVTEMALASDDGAEMPGDGDGAANAGMVAAGTQAAIMAARLPSLIFSGF